ncbi:MAG: FAD-dependent oxidoreductase [Gemmatimonadales bacterium]
MVGRGLVGLCCATAVARTGRRVTLVGHRHRGEASPAAAGMLAPSVEQASGPAHRFAIAARDFYPEFIESLADSTGIRVSLNRLGILQVALTEKGVRGLQKTAPPESRWLNRRELSELEPALGHAIGAVHNPDDGAVDNVALIAALTTLVEMTDLISSLEGEAELVEPGARGIAVRLASGESLEGENVVLAPGAWGASIGGAPGLAAVQPSRGQLVSYRSTPLRHVTYGPGGYLVPRTSGAIIAGSTMENVGFDSDTTPEGVEKVRSAAEEIAPALAVTEVTDSWAGLRPVTPDMLPVIGHDPDVPAIIYACGHARNGILLAPLTGETVAALVSGKPVSHDLSQFRPGRF